MSISTDQVINKLEAELAALKVANSDKEKTKHFSKIQILAELWLEEDSVQTPKNSEKKSKQVFPTPLKQTGSPVDLSEERSDGTSIFDF